jgi:hypothetical protein
VADSPTSLRLSAVFTTERFYCTAVALGATVVVATVGGGDRADGADPGDLHDAADAGRFERVGLDVGDVVHRTASDRAVVDRGAVTVGDDAGLTSRHAAVGSGDAGLGGRAGDRDARGAVGGTDGGRTGQVGSGGLVARAGAFDEGADVQVGRDLRGGVAAHGGDVATGVASEADRGGGRGLRIGVASSIGLGGGRRQSRRDGECQESLLHDVSLKEI